MDETKNKATGILVTLGFHALIIFLLIVLPGFVSETRFAGEGIEVALGTNIEGGPDQTMADQGGEQPQEATPPQNSGDNSPDKEMSTDENSESNVAAPDNKNKKNPAPKTNTKTDTKTPVNTKTDTKATPEKKVDENSLFKKKGKTNGNDGGDPNSNGYGGNKEGNKGAENGNPNGNPDGNNPTGNYGVKGGAQLVGRSVKKDVSISNDFEQEGILKLKIVVDRNGNVIDVRTAPGTTITSYKQKQQAIAEIKSNLKFNFKADADEEQSGYYVIIYKKK